MNALLQLELIGEFNASRKNSHLPTLVIFITMSLILQYPSQSLLRFIAGARLYICSTISFVEDEQ